MLTKSSLNVKIIIRLVLAVTLCVCFLGVTEFFQKKSQLEKNLETTLEEVSQRLGNSLSMPIWNADFEVVGKIVETEMLDRNIFAIIVVDEMSPVPITVKSRNKQWEVVELENTPNINYFKGKSISIEARGGHLGKVSVYVTDHFIPEELIDDLLQLVARMAFLLVFLIVFMMVFVSQIVSKPILNLSKICKRVAHGNYSLPLDVTRKDEIGSLARSFDQMRGAVREKITNLNREIIERRRYEQEMRKLRSYLTNIVDSMPSMLVGVDKKGCITQWNIEAKNVTGVEKENVLGKQLFTVLPWLDKKELDLLRFIETSKGQKSERVKLQVSGEEILTDITVYPLIEGTPGEHLGAVIRIDDIRDRVRLEEVMIQTEKMMSVGGLAAGMAHEINNPLAGMLQSVQVLQNRLLTKIEKNSEIAAEYGLELESVIAYMDKRGIPTMLDSIVESGKRASRIISNMLSFSRKSESLFTEQDVVKLLDQTVDLASNDYDLKKKYDFRKIKIIRSYSEEKCLIRCDPSSIQQVFLNILKNAAQAMLGEAGNSTPEIRLAVLCDGNTTKITISDNGSGIDGETKKRIFEPFFTTKKIGEGTGLGLSVSFFIIKENHKGNIEVESSPGKGTSFIITLPV